MPQTARSSDKTQNRSANYQTYWVLLFSRMEITALRKRVKLRFRQSLRSGDTPSSSEVKGWRLSAKIKLTHYSTPFATKDHLWRSQTHVTVPSAESIRRRILSRAARARPSTERKSSIVIAELLQPAGRKCLQEVDGLPKNCRRDSVRRLSGST